MELTERESTIYRDGIRHGTRQVREEMQATVEGLMTKLYGQGGAEERAEHFEAWARNLYLMLLRVVRSGLNEKRKNQAGELLRKAREQMGIRHSILREAVGPSAGGATCPTETKP